uniref:Delta(24(24(1)))-sterol reductase n=1 Tax=Pseudictyota dubia TaxID=2749911 RepID=A0A7R9WIE8_9STRA|mmetsp:Transcript_6598/g.11600  ORF Transcript_6598/g.11600 Transcript_6598/m.11600 type:complete len:562 (+) Transcript_6598:194-1879(+)
MPPSNSNNLSADGAVVDDAADVSKALRRRNTSATCGSDDSDSSDHAPPPSVASAQSSASSSPNLTPTSSVVNLTLKEAEKTTDKREKRRLSQLSQSAAFRKEVEVDARIKYEFGGPVGVTFLMAFFPALMLYMYICLLRQSGRLANPFDAALWEDGLPHVMPTMFAAKLYLGFSAFQVLTAMTLPGIVVKGLPVPSLGGRQLEYLCNGVATWYVDLAILAVVITTGVFDMADVIDNVGPIMSVAILTSFLITIVTYSVSVVKGTTHRMSGSLPYDMFMGAVLNPRIGKLDLKMWSEIRVPWKILFLISLSAAVKDHEMNAEIALEQGLPSTMDFMGLSLPIIRTSAPILFMLLAHTLYVNACMKGEECIPTTWDIFYEKWGYMLIYWNMAGVPFSYCYSTVYLSNRAAAGDPISHSAGFTAFLFVALLAAYYVWDTANSQKNRFRMQERGTYVERRTFPQLPWGTLKNPTYIVTRHGNKLLTGGWWGVARKIHYTADLVMALSWGLITGFESPIPYFYFTFFVTVLTHRVSRDMEHCKDKYGEDWDRYTKEVPYIFIPFVF